MIRRLLVLPSNNKTTILARENKRLRLISERFGINQKLLRTHTRGIEHPSKDAVLLSILQIRLPRHDKAAICEPHHRRVHLVLGRRQIQTLWLTHQGAVRIKYLTVNFTARRIGSVIPGHQHLTIRQQRERWLERLIGRVEFLLIN